MTGMQLRVLGCSGGASLRHKQVSFLLDGVLALDAGSLAGALSLVEQARVHTALISHAHMDHVCDLGPFTDLRCQGGGEALEVLASANTIADLREHVFNDRIWPDFTRLPAAARPALRLVELEPELAIAVLDYLVTPVPVHHAVATCGYVVQGPTATLAFSADTGPTERFWQVAREAPRLAAVITEVSLPDRCADLARASGHLTPGQLRAERDKLGRPDVPLLVYGLKPLHEAEIRAELEFLGIPELRVLEGGERIELLAASREQP